ncbi:hypothetical protein ARMGADRAFT_1035842 [Armillaria gallica]|uniref:Uncharacterized protein n=1 Tax=Armillaria gallica TaxID=47427 RepID=A0A2H3CSW1_ARMGA|nr:hypothetical protein ARMGADRAFT_1035842 [Armillaria gallica]
MNDKDGGQGEDDLEPVAMLGVAYIMEIGTLLSLPVVDKHHGGTIIECYDGTTKGDWAEVRVKGVDFVQCPVVTQMEEHNFLLWVSIELYPGVYCTFWQPLWVLVSMHDVPYCQHQPDSLGYETGDPITVISLFGMRREPASQCNLVLAMESYKQLVTMEILLVQGFAGKNSDSNGPHVEYSLRLGSSAESVELVLRLPLLIKLVLPLNVELDAKDIGWLIAIPVMLPVMLVEVMVIDDCPQTTAIRQSREKGTTLENTRGMHRW